VSLFTAWTAQGIVRRGLGLEHTSVDFGRLHVIHTLEL
jgi:hypothetical protein